MATEQEPSPEPDGSENDRCLRYKFIKSRSKRFADVLEIAKSLSGFREEGNEYWIDLSAGSIPSAGFREVERTSQYWKGSCYLVGDKEVSREDWWRLVDLFGKRFAANTEDDWKDIQVYLEWGRPENLIVGESHRQDNLRSIARVKPSVLTMLPVTVVLQRDSNNHADPNAVKALVDEVHVGFLSAERARVIGRAMDREAIKEMEVCGIMTGRERLGVHIWPYQLLSNGIVVGDIFQPEPVRFKEIFLSEIETYFKARKKHAYRPKPTQKVTPPAMPQIQHNVQPADPPANVGAGCLGGGGVVCLLIAAPYLFKHGIDTIMGVNFLIFGIFGVVMGLGAWASRQ